MTTLSVKFTHSPLLLLLLLLMWFDRCDSLTDSSLPAIFYPFGTDEGDSIVATGYGNCDGPVDIPYEIFNYTTVYVCTHGLVSFGSPISNVIGSIPRGYGPPFIAVNWFGFHTYNSSDYNKGRVYYRSTMSDASLLTMASHTVQHALSPQGYCDFQSTWALVVTWHNVSVYSTRTTRTTFQLVVTSDTERHVLIFHYGAIDYKRTYGFDSRDGYNYVDIPYGEIPYGTNAGFAGRWVFPAAISTPKFTSKHVRLAGSGVTYEGRLEVLHNGIWGTVCDDGFSDTDARVFCYQLGFGYNGQYINHTHGSGTGQIWLDDVGCTGRESDIMECQHAGWGWHNCDHSEDVSISCFFDSTTQYAVRLVDGPSPYEGRLEVLHNGVWGTVCDDLFTDVEAQVACYMLGFGHTGRFLSSHYGAGTGRIWLDNVLCNGTELDIGSCSHRGWGVGNCYHNEDVSISCRPVPIRLAGSNVTYEGRLEVLHNESWGTVCDNDFSDADARVFCFQLGFGYNGQYIGNTYEIGSGPIWLDNVWCTGHETDVMQCRHAGWGTHNCTHSQDVSISCFYHPERQFALRLVGGPSPYEGRLELLFNGYWGTVCGWFFTNAHAQVACYMLGFGRTGRFRSNLYGSGTERLWALNSQCDGTELDITRCPYERWYSILCSRSFVASISCIPSETQAVPMRLVGTERNALEGRLEVFHDGSWGTVCDDGFDDIAAKVACNGLGFGYVGHVLGNVHAHGSGRIWLDEVSCPNDSCLADLNRCSHSQWGVHDCHHGEDVSIACYDHTATAEPTTAPRTTTATTSTTAPESSAVKQQTTEQTTKQTTFSVSSVLPQGEGGGDSISDITLIIIVVVAVAGLIIIALIVCAIVIIACAFSKKRDRNPPATAQVAMVPVDSLPLAASNNNFNIEFDNASGKTDMADTDKNSHNTFF